MTQLQTPSTLLMGEPGTGKTFSLHTLVRAGLETFVLVTEPGGTDTLLDSFHRTSTPIDRLHWHYVPPASPGLDNLVKMAETINRQSYDDITKIKSGVAKNQMTQMIDFLRSIQDFPCDRTNTTYGDVTTWGPDRAFVIDSLSGLNVMAMDNAIGLKPAAHQGEWGVAMNLEEKLLLQLTSSCRCLFVLIAHVTKDANELTGIKEINPAALGSKLGPRLGRFFSEVVLARREADKGRPVFSWSTSESGANLKNRALEFGGRLPPDFGPIWTAHQRRSASLGTQP